MAQIVFGKWANLLTKVYIFALFVSLAACSKIQNEQAIHPSFDIPDAVTGIDRLISEMDLVTLRETGGMIGTGLSVSPDGKYVAFEMHQADLAKNSYRVAWFVAPTTQPSIPVNVGAGGDPTLFKYESGAWISEYAKWSPDSRGIVYRKKIDDQTQLWWSDREGTETKQLTRNAADVDNFVWSHDGSKIYYSTDADRNELIAVEESLYHSGYVFDFSMSWSTIEGKPNYPPYSAIGGKARIWVLEIVSGIGRRATNDEKEEYEQLGQNTASLEHLPEARKVSWAANKGNVAWLQADDPEKQGLTPPLTLYASLEPSGNNPIRCPASECSGIMDMHRPLKNGLDWSNNGHELLFVRKEGIGYSKRTLYGWRIGDGQVRKILSTDEWLSDCSIVQNRAICFRETPRYPRVIISVDLTDGAIETLVDPNPEFRNLIIGDVELLEWENSEGIETFGYLVKPVDYVPGQRYPLVFVGYRARMALRGGVGDEYPVHVLAANGYVVLAYDKPQPLEAYEIYNDDIDIGQAMWGDLFDVRMPLASFKSAIALLAEQGLVDPGRVAVTGLSAGAGDVNYALIHSDTFKTAITSSSGWAPSAYYVGGSHGEFIRKYRTAIGAGPYGSPEGTLWSYMSLALNAEQVDAPLLVNAADSEHINAIEEVISLIEKDKPIEMVVYPDEGHIKWHPTHRLSVYERNVDWMNFWLRDVEDADPEKTAQYERWRKLREQHENNLADQP